MRPRLPLAILALLLSGPLLAAEPSRSLRFQAKTPEEARAWQAAARGKLFSLMMGGGEPERGPLDREVKQRVESPADGYAIEEITLRTLPDRRVRAWVARPLRPAGKVGAVLALNGHGGDGEQVIRGTSLYWYGRALAEMGYVVIAPDIGQHELQHENWSLMGERTWDALRCLDYVATLPEVDPEKLAVAGLSLGGETTMYVAALDERIKLACSSGWLTTVANMKNGHCECFDFPGLEENFDFADIFACVAPRPLVVELGAMERAPGGFPMEIGRGAFAEVQAAYRVFGKSANATMTAHSAGHVFNGRDFLPMLQSVLGPANPQRPKDEETAAWIRFDGGPESFDGKPYYWLGRDSLLVTFDAAPRPGRMLELRWGAKSDHREARLRINGRPITVRGGGWWGYRWLRVPIPDGIDGDHYAIDFERGGGSPAFLSEVRLTEPGGSIDHPPLAQPSFRAKVAASSAAKFDREAFPEMRAVWDRDPPPPLQPSREDEFFRLAERNGRLANEAFFRCRRFVDGWLAHADPETGLIPRNLGESRDFWNGRDSAADNYAFMVLTAAMTDRPLFQGRMLDMLRTETRLTNRLGRIPDDYSFSKKGWRRDELILDEIVFDGAEYAKDGLIPITEWLGASPWSERMTGILDDIWERAAIDSPHGKLPTLNFEVTGDLLQACSRAYWFTGDRKYLDWAVRLGDYYLLGGHHPTRDAERLRLVDHGCEVVNGLTELYVAVSRAMPEKKAAYQAPMRAMFDDILEKGRNEDGLLYVWFNPKTGEHSAELCDTWGYDYDGVYTMWLVDRVEAYRDAVRKVLGNLKGKYVGACWGDKSADGFADSIEGAINLLNREPNDSAADWVDAQTRMMWAIQRPDGVIEGWHGDGNFARTSLMYALWKTQGVTVEPWRADARFGAARDDAALLLTLEADQPWKGRAVFDQPRHKTHMRLPLDYPRINQFPEWFTVEADAKYLVSVDGSEPTEIKGADLIAGLPLEARPGHPIRVVVRPR